MSTRRRRTPAGTQPPPRAITSTQQMEAAGTIWLETEPVAMQELEEDAVSRALDEQTVVVQIDDEWLAWLARAHLATD